MFEGLSSFGDDITISVFLSFEYRTLYFFCHHVIELAADLVEQCSAARYSLLVYHAICTCLLYTSDAADE